MIIFGCYKEVLVIESEKGLNYCIYYVMMKDFNIFFEIKLFFNFDFSVIDVVIVCDLVMKDLIMVVKNENLLLVEKNLRIIWIIWIEDGFFIIVFFFIIGNYWCEGFVLFFVDDVFYVYFDKYCNY